MLLILSMVTDTITRRLFDSDPGALTLTLTIDSNSAYDRETGQEQLVSLLLAATHLSRGLMSLLRLLTPAAASKASSSSALIYTTSPLNRRRPRERVRVLGAASERSSTDPLTPTALWSQQRTTSDEVTLSEKISFQPHLLLVCSRSRRTGCMWQQNSACDCNEEPRLRRKVSAALLVFPFME